MVVRGLADLEEPQRAVEHERGDFFGPLPGLRLADHLGVAVAGEGELAGQTMMRILVDDAAHRRWIKA